jgi:hypothetical protein
MVVPAAWHHVFPLIDKNGRLRHIGNAIGIFLKTHRSPRIAAAGFPLLRTQHIFQETVAAVITAALLLVGPLRAPASSAPPVERQEEVVVEAIHFSADDPRGEKVCILLSHHEVPVLGVVEGERPRVYMDFLQVSGWKGPESRPVAGRFVKRIRGHLHAGSGRLRIVLDMVPDVQLFVDQRYFALERIFCLWISDQPLEEPVPKGGPGHRTEPR